MSELLRNLVEEIKHQEWSKLQSRVHFGHQHIIGTNTDVVLGGPEEIMIGDLIFWDHLMDRTGRIWQGHVGLCAESPIHHQREGQNHADLAIVPTIECLGRTCGAGMLTVCRTSMVEYVQDAEVLTIPWLPWKRIRILRIRNDEIRAALQERLRETYNYLLHLDPDRGPHARMFRTNTAEMHPIRFGFRDIVNCPKTIITDRREFMESCHLMQTALANGQVVVRDQIPPSERRFLCSTYAVSMLQHALMLVFENDYDKVAQFCPLVAKHCSPGSVYYYLKQSGQYVDMLMPMYTFLSVPNKIMSNIDPTWNMTPGNLPKVILTTMYKQASLLMRQQQNLSPIVSCRMAPLYNLFFNLQYAMICFQYHKDESMTKSWDKRILPFLMSEVRKRYPQLHPGIKAADFLEEIDAMLKKDISIPRQKLDQIKAETIKKAAKFFGRSDVAYPQIG